MRPATNPTPHADDRQTAPESTRAEFVDLRSVGTPERQPGNATYSSVAHRERQRNRAEVMRLAREMLQSGTPKDNVRNLLPISDGELALLEHQRA